MKYSRVPNCRAEWNKRVGWNIFEILISEQDLISKQGKKRWAKLANFFMNLEKLGKTLSSSWFFNKRAGSNKSKQGGIFRKNK